MTPFDSGGCGCTLPIAATVASSARCHRAAAGIKFTHNSGRAGKKFLPERMGSGGAFFDAGRRRLAGHPSYEQQGLDAARAALGRRVSIATTATARFTNITAGSGLDVEIYGMGVAAADYDNDGKADSTSPRSKATGCSTTKASGKFRDVTKAIGHRQRELRHERGLARLRQGRQARPVRRQLRAVDAQRRSLVLARRRDQVVLHAGIVQGHASKLYRNLGGGNLTM